MRDELKRLNAVEVVPNRFLYRGMCFDLNHEPAEIMSTDYEFYKYIKEEHRALFDTKPFREAVSTYLRDKYKKKLGLLEMKMRDEVNKKNNHNVISYLKSTRKFYINKYKDAENIR